MFAFRSFDGGFSWTPPYTVQPDTDQFWDLPRLTADPRKPKTAYYVYDLREPPDLLHGYSVLLEDHRQRAKPGRRRRTLYDPGTTNSWPGISKILVNDDGSLLCVMDVVETDFSDPDAPEPAQELAVRSTDGGRTWGKPITIGSSSGEPVNDPVTDTGLNTFVTYPSQTVAPNGDVYVSWLQPGATNQSSRIAVARSTDGGRHWHTTQIAVDGQAALPTVEVAGDGTVGVVYYSDRPAEQRRQLAGARRGVPPRRDHGRHWSRQAWPGRSTC